MPSSEPAARRLGRTLLIIDDDEHILEMLQYLFKGQLERIWATTDPREGIRIALTYKPELILLDHHMPGMTGLELLQQLRDMPSTRHLPVIMMTADSSANTVQRAVQAQVAGYLLKPLEPAILRNKISQWLDLEPPQPAVKSV